MDTGIAAKKVNTNEITKSRFTKRLNQDCLLGFFERGDFFFDLVAFDDFFGLLAEAEDVFAGRFTGRVLLMGMSIKTAYLGCNQDRLFS
jgi:hypothetical protein